MNLVLKKNVILLCILAFSSVAFSDDDSGQPPQQQSNGMLVGLGAMIGGTVAQSIRISTDKQIASIGIQSQEKINTLNMMTGLKLNMWQNLFRQQENKVAFDQKMKDLALKDYAQNLDRRDRQRTRLAIYEKERLDKRERRRREFFKFLLKNNEQKYKTMVENIMISRRQAQNSLMQLPVEQNPALVTQAGFSTPINVVGGLSVSRFPNAAQMMQTGNYTAGTLPVNNTNIARGSTASDLKTFTNSVAAKTVRQPIQGVPRTLTTQPSQTGTH